jgi:predicted amidohydrolase
MRIAAVQHDIVWCDRAANFGRLAPMIAGAAASGAHLVLLTETFSTGFATDIDNLGEPTDGPSATFLRQQASTHGVWVGGSCPEIVDTVGADTDGVDSDRRPHNTFVLAGPDGTVHRYRKIHPFSYGGEDKHFRAGSQMVTVSVPDPDANGTPLRLTLFVCYDLRFADEFWQRAQDTDVYLLPANWPEARRQHWITLLHARAIENQAYVVGCNRVGSGGGLAYSGDSRIVDPLGEALATAAIGESVLLADVSASRVAEVRDRFRFLQDRRT